VDLFKRPVALGYTHAGGHRHEADEPVCDEGKVKTMKNLMILFVLSLMPAAAFSKTIHVPGDYGTIQEAIDAAVNGDSVVVHPGNYVENIDFKGKAIWVKSSNGPGTTIIDGGKPSVPEAGSVVTFTSNESPASILEGFTLIHGTGRYFEFYPGYWDWCGGGIFCDAASPTIRNNIIAKNTPEDRGGGIWCSGGSKIVIHDNNIIDNTVNFVGGGIHCFNASPKIIHNHIMANTADQSGGGMLIVSCSAEIHDNMIGGNTAKTNSGGGVFLEDNIDCTTVMTNNIIINNKAGYGGGGIMCWQDRTLVFNNNTVAKNSANHLAGGFYCDGSKVFLANAILWNNLAPEGPEGYVIESAAFPSRFVISHSDVKGGLKGFYVHPNSKLVWKEGMIHATPLFKDPPKGDYHLTRFSPCINMGTNEKAPPKDMDGDPRPFMGTADMGADEFTGPHSLAADRFTISESTGNIIHFKLDAGLENGGRDYLVYGSISGNAPGTPLPGGKVFLPINWDVFTNIVADLNYPESVIFKGFYGTLDAAGHMNAAFDTGGPVPGMAGYRVSFAYPLQGPPWDFASNPVNIDVVK
jgi:hypothetical protein